MPRKVKAGLAKASPLKIRAEKEQELKQDVGKRGPNPKKYGNRIFTSRRDQLVRAMWEQ